MSKEYVICRYYYCLSLFIVQIRLSEALLQQMLKIDGMPIISDEGVRQQRRELVRWINGMLERVDEHKGKLSGN
jgi:hypothetical protein